MLTIWPIRGLESVSGRCWIMEIWSKVKVTLISQSWGGRRSVVLPGRPRQLWYFSLKSVSREDVHLTQFWSILTKQSRGSGLCLFWPATTAVSWSHFQASHWSSRYRECLWLAADVTGKLWPQVIQLFDFCPLSPLSTLPLLSVSPSLCTVRPGHYHIFISLFSWEFPDCSLISPPELSNPDSRGLWEEIQGPRHILFQQFCSPSTQHPRLQMKNDLWNLVHVHTSAE